MVKTLTGPAMLGIPVARGVGIVTGEIVTVPPATENVPNVCPDAMDVGPIGSIRKGVPKVWPLAIAVGLTV